MLQQINRTLEKLIPYITPTAVVVGIIFSAYLKDFSYLVPWLFAFMTFEGSLTMNIRSIKGVMTSPASRFHYHRISTYHHAALGVGRWTYHF